MARGWGGVVVMAAVWGAGGCFRAPAPDEELEVVQIEDDVAQVYDRAADEARIVPRSALPPDAREGDVVVHGDTDPVLSAQLRAEVEQARARQARHAVQGGHVPLDDLPGAPDPEPPGADFTR